MAALALPGAAALRGTAGDLTMAGPPPPAARPAWAGHQPALDGVRGLAILMVLLYHFVGQTTATNRAEAAVNWVLSHGLLGVDLFFVLSGFLITGILYDSRGTPDYFKSFYMRRVLRIFPLYYAVLAVLFFVVPLVPALRSDEILRLEERQSWAWLYGINLYLAREGGWVLSYIEHFWSLAVEEHFYFVWPLLVWLLGGRPRVLMAATLGIAAASFAGRVAASLAGVNPVATTVLTPFQLDALCLGGFLAVCLRQPGGEAALRRAVVPLALLLGAALACDFAVHRFTEFGISVSRAVRGGLFRGLFAALLLGALFAPATSLLARFFKSRSMVTLGKYSYGLYVYHHFLSYYFVSHGTEFALARAVGSHTLAVALQAAGGMAVSMGVAWMSYEFFEKHFLQLKRFWPSSSSARLAAATLALVACVGAEAGAADRPLKNPDAKAAQAPAGYTIGLGDVLRVVVWKEPDLTLDATVRLDGMITLPLLGDVQAAGRAPSELARALVTDFGQFVESPRISVSVSQATSARVFVVGQMVRPGEFPLSGRMTVLKALALAGGFKDYARPEDIVIIREDMSVIPFNFKRVADGKDVSQNVLLQAGDTIVVP